MQSYAFLDSAAVSSISCAAAHGLRGFAAPQGLQPFFAAHGFFAAPGLPSAAFCRRGITQRLVDWSPLAPQGLQPPFGAHGLQGFFTAHGLQPFFAAQGLHPRRPAQGLHARFAPQGFARAGLSGAEPKDTAPATPTTTASGITAVDNILFFDPIVSSMQVRDSVRSSGLQIKLQLQLNALIACAGVNPGHHGVIRTLQQDRLPFDFRKKYRPEKFSLTDLIELNSKAAAVVLFVQVWPPLLFWKPANYLLGEWYDDSLAGGYGDADSRGNFRVGRGAGRR